MTERASIRLRRQSRRLLAVRTIEVARSAWVVIAPLVAVAGTSGGWLRFGCLGALSYFLYTRLVRIVLDWWTIRYRVSQHGVEVRTGLISVEVRTFGWDAITAVASRDEFAQRMLGCCEVAISMTAVFGTEVILPCVRRCEAERISRLHASHAPLTGEAPGAPIEPLMPSEMTTRLTPPLRTRDHIIVGISTGRALLVMPFAAAAAPYVLPVFGADPSASAVVASVLSGDPRHTVVLLVSLVALGPAYGAFRSWVRFRGYRATLVINSIQFSAGLFRREARVVQLRAVAAVVSEPGWVLASFGRTRVKCVTASGAGQLTAGVLLPTVEISRARKTNEQVFGVQCVPQGLAPRRARILLGVGLILTALVVLGVLIRQPLLSGIGAALLVVLAGARMVDGLRGRIHLVSGKDGRWVILHRGALSATEWAARCEAIDLVSWHRVVLGAWPIEWVTMSVRGSRSYRLRVAGVGLRTMASLRSALNERQAVDLLHEGSGSWHLLK